MQRAKHCLWILVRMAHMDFVPFTRSNHFSKHACWPLVCLPIACRDYGPRCILLLLLRFAASAELRPCSDGTPTEGELGGNSVQAVAKGRTRCCCHKPFNPRIGHELDCHPSGHEHTHCSLHGGHWLVGCLQGPAQEGVCSGHHHRIHRRSCGLSFSHLPVQEVVFFRRGVGSCLRLIEPAPNGIICSPVFLHKR